MKRLSDYKGVAALVLAATLFLLTGFCIISLSTEEYRLYLDEDIPFVYQLNSSTPVDYIDAIEAGHNEWNDVPSSYFEFTRGENTSANSPSFDGINLLFFDLTGSNFGPPPSNVIAFSQTWTSFTGGYHAIESDLIWNARDFPPSPTGQQGFIDLQGVVAHEFGHHLGLGHQGPFGGPPGCGETILEAVMYGSVSTSDTSNRHLHIHDIAGVSAIYPSWILTGTVTNSSNSDPVEGASVEYIGTNSLSVGPSEFNQTWQRPGDVFTIEYTGPTGEYGNIVLDQEFDVVVDGYGFLPDTASIGFDPPGGIGMTQTLTHDVSLTVAPTAAISGLVTDALTEDPVSGRVEFYGTDDPAGLSSSTTIGPDGSYSVDVYAFETYRIVLIPDAPYEDSVVREDVFLPGTGTTVDFELEEAEVLLVDDDGGENYETYYTESLDRTNIRRRTFSVADSGTVPTDILATFSHPPHLLWFTGNETTECLTEPERLSIIDHFENGGNAIITGQNIAEYSDPGDTLLTDYLGIEFTDNTTAIAVWGFPGDIIGEGGVYLVTGAGNQTSKDYVSITGGSMGEPTRTLYYSSSPGDSSHLAGVRVEGGTGTWKAVYFAVGLEGFSVFHTDSFLVRSIRYFNLVTGVGEPDEGLPAEFVISQNYPNPFNPSTEISYALPEKSTVSLLVYNMLGQEVNRLVEAEQPAGRYRTAWRGISDSGHSLASGVYFYRIEATGESGKRFVDVKKMLLLR